MANQIIDKALAYLGNNVSYKAGDTITINCSAIGRALNSQQGVYVTVILDKPVTASNVSISGGTVVIYSTDGGKARDTSASYGNVSHTYNAVTFSIPITGTVLNGALVYCEITNITINFL